MSTHKLFFAGAGGQGILLMGQVVTYAAMMEEKEATFLPSYGPEMRGGTANCTVVVSDRPVACPIISEADAVIAMNLPSLLKFEPLLKPGGLLFVDVSLVEQKPLRADVEFIPVAASAVARHMGNARAANMVMLGEVIRRTGVVGEDAAAHVLEKVFSGKKHSLLALNLEAFATH